MIKKGQHKREKMPVNNISDKGLVSRLYKNSYNSTIKRQLR